MSKSREGEINASSDVCVYRVHLVHCISLKEMEILQDHYLVTRGNLIVLVTNQIERIAVMLMIPSH
jgi:hypothetical protein